MKISRAFEIVKYANKCQQSFIELKYVLNDRNNEVEKYLHTSFWNVNDLLIFVKATGKLPPDEFKCFPNEVLSALPLMMNERI